MYLFFKLFIFSCFDDIYLNILLLYEYEFNNLEFQNLPEEQQADLLFLHFVLQ